MPPVKHVQAGAHTLAYDEVRPAGEARGTVLFLTGLGGNRLGWRWQLRTFGASYWALAPDHRDIGDSAPVTEDYEVGDQADDAAGLLRALGAAPAHVVGLSMGGFVALHLALRSPELVRSLTLVGTSAGGPGSFVERARAGQIPALEPDFSLPTAERTLRTYARMLPPGFLEAHPRIAQSIAAGAAYRPQGAQTYARQRRAALGHDVSGELAFLRVPTLVIHGAADPVIPLRDGERLAEQIPGAELLTYAGVGHLPPLERAETFNRDVLAFVERHTP